jgi:hypothetical protein
VSSDEKPVTTAEQDAVLASFRREVELRVDEEELLHGLRGQLAAVGVKSPHLLSPEDLNLIAGSVRAARELSKMDHALIAEIPRRGRDLRADRQALETILGLLVVFAMLVLAIWALASL